MENEGKIKEIKISKLSKLRMFLKFIRMYLYKFIKRRWYLPGVSEMTVDDLFDRISSDRSPILIDVTEPKFYGNGQNKLDNVQTGYIPNAKLIPILQLSANLEDLHSYLEEEIVTICPGGGMSLIAVDIMVEAGFKNVKSLTGGMELWIEKGYPVITAEDVIYSLEDIKPSIIEGRTKIVEGKQPLDEKSQRKVHYTLDARGLLCPQPILKSKKKLKTIKMGQVLEILTTDPGSLRDIPAWAHVTGQELLVSEESGPKEFRFLVKRMK